ncbi:MAG: hypothetical protein RJA07_1441 [Bacteroidota bacterium]|jgi:hypothetical protein
MTIKRTIIIFISTLAGCIVGFLFNVFVVYNIIIPDPCYYHNHDFKTSRLFNLFYEITGAEGYHPTPTMFNIIFALVVGALLGFTLSFYKTKKQNNN